MQDVPDPRNPNLDGDQGFDLKLLLAILTRRRWIWIVVTILVLCATWTWLTRQPKVYRANTSIIIDITAPKFLGSDVQDVVDLGGGRGRHHQSYQQTQFKVVRSRVIAERVVNRLELHKSERFLGNWTKSARKNENPVEFAIRKLLNSTKVQPVRGTWIAKISVSHIDPELATQLANAVTQEFIEFNVEHKVSAAQSAVHWLKDQMDTAQSSLGGSERALHEFKSENNILSVSLEDSQNLLMGNIRALNGKVTSAQSVRIQLNAQRQAIKNLQTEDPQKMVFPDLESSRSLQRHKERYTKAADALTALEDRYLDQHPQVIAARSSLASAHQNLKDEVEGLVRSVEAEYQVALHAERQLATELNRAKSRALELNKKEMDYKRLQREQKTGTELLSMLQSRLKESDLTSQISANNVRLLDSAVVPRKPFKPRKKLVMLVSGVFGLLLGMLLALVRERLDDRIKAPGQVEALVGIPVLGTVPALISDKDGGKDQVGPPDLHIHRQPKSGAAECLRSIRTNLLFATAGKKHERLLITSAVPREGKTTLAICIAVSLAQSGRRILVVDTDLRRPRMHKPFAIRRTPGLTNVLVQEEPVEDVIRTTDVENLDLLPSGPLPPNPAELLETEEFSGLLDRLAEKYDCILLDTPPINAVTDALVAGRLVDGIIVIARMGESSTKQLRQAVGRLKSVDLPLLGCVVNDVDPRAQSYGYGSYYGGYGYYYHYNYNYGAYGSDEEGAEQAPA